MDEARARQGASTVTFEKTWNELRERCRDLEALLVTPSEDRAFSIGQVDEDAVVVRFRDSETDRTLWRDQFAFLHDRLHRDAEGLDLTDLPSGVEPYVSILSLSSRYAVDDSGNLRHDEEATGGESPFLREEWEVRSSRERVRDDALLLADLLERHDLGDLEGLPSETLVDLYVQLSDVQRGADDLRRSIGDVLLDRIGPTGRAHGRFGSITRTERERRHLEDEGRILSVLDEHGVPHEWVLGVDPDKLDVVVSATDVEENEVYEIDRQVYVRKSEVEEAEKQTHLRGIEERLALLETPEAEELREDIEDVEERLEELLAS